MKKLNNHGMTLVEISITLAIFSIMGVIFIKAFSDLNRNISKTQQYTELQRLAQQSLSEMASQLRQTVDVRTTQAGDIPENAQFALLPNGGNQVCIYVPKLSNPSLAPLADRIIYTLDNYQGRPNRLMQQLTTFRRNMAGNIVVDVSYPAVPILTSMEGFRNNPTAPFESPLAYIYNNPQYQFENVTFFWDHNADPDSPRGVMAIGITMSARAGGNVSRFFTSTVITSRAISGVPR